MRKFFVGLMFLLFPISLFAGIEEAKQFYAAKNYDQAIAEANAVLQSDPQNKDALAILVNSYQNKKDYKNYILFSKKFLEAGGKINGDVLWPLANLCHEMKDYESVVFFVKIYNTIQPNNHSAYNLIGVAYYYLNKYRLSVIALKTAVLFMPNEPIYSANLARSYEALGEYQKAYDFYKISLKNDPNFGRAALSLKRVETLLQNKNN